MKCPKCNVKEGLYIKERFEDGSCVLAHPCGWESGKFSHDDARNLGIRPIQIISREWNGG